MIIGEFFNPKTKHLFKDYAYFFIHNSITIAEIMYFGEKISFPKFSDDIFVKPTF